MNPTDPGAPSYQDLYSALQEHEHAAKSYLAVVDAFMQMNRMLGIITTDAAILEAFASLEELGKAKPLCKPLDPKAPCYDSATFKRHRPQRSIWSYLFWE